MYVHNAHISHLKVEVRAWLNSESCRNKKKVDGLTLSKDVNFSFFICAPEKVQNHSTRSTNEIKC